MPSSMGNGNPNISVFANGANALSSFFQRSPDFPGRVTKSAAKAIGAWTSD